MIKNYFKTAWRNMAKNKLATLINILGLAIGISCSLLIGLWARDEMSYNRFIPGFDAVYEVHVNVPVNGDTVTQTIAGGPLEPALRKDVPQFAAVTKMRYSPDMLFTAGNASLKEKGWYATDDFFKVFPLAALDGYPDQAIRSIDQVVITKGMAMRYFNTVFAAGKHIKVDNNKEYTIGAVIEDLPHNSTLDFNWLMNFKIGEQDWMQKWGNISFPTYVRLLPHVSVADAERAMRAVYKNNAPDGFKTLYPFLQPVKDIYLYSKYENGKIAGGRIEYVKIFSLAAFFILLIACVNFTNMATAKASQRGKEIGVRKVAGAGRCSLISQFIGEAVLISVLAAAVAFFITWLLLPVFNRLFDKNIAIPFGDPRFWMITVGALLLTALLAGSYPAVVLSSFKPVSVLKGNATSGNRSGNTIRRILVTLQMTVSAFLIIGVLVVSKQIHFIQNKNLGFDKEHLMYVPLDGKLYTSLQSYQDELNRLPGIVAATPVNTLPMDLMTTSSDLVWPGKPPELESDITATCVGYDFTKTMGIGLTEGRDFSRAYPGDSATYIINEAAAKMMGLKNAVGTRVHFWNGDGPIVGVMKDFHMASMHSAINPLILCLTPLNTSYMLICLKAGNIRNTIEAVRQLTHTFNPGYPFDYHFADDTYAKMYAGELQVSALVRYFGILAIIISCLGLFGMITFSVTQKVKEIGIRKVLGASVGTIVGLLSKESLVIVSFSVFIAFPLAYWACNIWLTTFHYRISLGIGLFLGALVLLLLVTFITVGFHAIKAAIANPVKSLRNE